MNDKYSLTEIINMDLPPIIVYAVPVMLFFVGLEFAIRSYQNRNNYIGLDFLSSALIGVGNLLTSAVFKLGMFATVWFFYYYLSPFNIPNTWWSYILCLVALDLARYWAHRIAHEKRFLWATHVTHHSSENYNFAVSFRLSWVQHIKVIFFLPVAMMGFDPFVFFVCHQIEVLYQFWIHTELINRFPKPIEYIFTTPSHHRVHHATNAKYIDKNYGSTFIIWDRIFGTFQPEEEKAIYGITKPVNSYNPVYLVFHEWMDIFRDFGKAKTWKAKWHTLWGHPNDFADKSPSKG